MSDVSVSCCENFCFVAEAAFFHVVTFPIFAVILVMFGFSDVNCFVAYDCEETLRIPAYDI